MCTSLVQVVTPLTLVGAVRVAVLLGAGAALSSKPARAAVTRRALYPAQLTAQHGAGRLAPGGQATANNARFPAA